MKRFALLASIVMVTLSAAALASTATAAPPQSTSVTVPVTSTFTDSVGGTGTFVGTYEIERFTKQNGGLAAVTTVTGTAVDSLGNMDTVNRQVTLPLQATGTCDILHLELGPLDLDLLGLVVHLDQVVLDITAEQGPGNLLGNLLCAVAGLLDPPTTGGGGLGGLLNGIVALLNQILGALG
jgi:hypothetical protein